MTEGALARARPRGWRARGLRGAWPAGSVHGWVLGCWALLAAAGALTDLYGVVRLGEPVDLVRIAAGNAASAAVWAGVLALALALMRSRDGVSRRDVAGLLLLAAFLAALRQVADYALWCAVLWSACPRTDPQWSFRLLTLPNAVAVVVNLFAVGWSVRAITLARERRARTSAAQEALFRAQMRALERQLRPHFLFNALQSVTELAERDPHGAREMLLALRRLFEHAVRSAQATAVPLREEMEIVRLYLDVESRRFGDRLAARVDAEAGALDASVPAFFLQPLVENAVHHAVAVRGEGRIGIGVARAGDRLVVTITDTGPGAAAAPGGGHGGTGMRNVRSRLALLYGTEWELELRPAENGSALRISIPFQEAGAPGAGQG